MVIHLGMGYTIEVTKDKAFVFVYSLIKETCIKARQYKKWKKKSDQIFWRITWIRCLYTPMTWQVFVVWMYCQSTCSMQSSHAMTITKRIELNCPLSIESLELSLKRLQLGPLKFQDNHQEGFIVPLNPNTPRLSEAFFPRFLLGLIFSYGFFSLIHMLNVYDVCTSLI